MTTIAPAGSFVNPWGIIGADTDGDMIEDVIVQDKTNVHIVKMRADGNAASNILNTLIPIAGFGKPIFVIPVDINNDGSAPDLITVESQPDGGTAGTLFAGQSIRIQVYSNDGFGAFSAQPLITCSAGNNNPTLFISGRPVSANLDGDKFPEIVIGSFADATRHVQSPVFIIDNIGGVLASTCVALNENGAVPGGLSPSGVNIADMNGDGSSDIVVGNYMGSSVAVFPGNGTISGFTTSTPINLTGGFAINGIDIADLNGDGKPDIVAANAEPVTPSVEIFFNKGGMTFVNQSLIADIAPAPQAALTRIQYNQGTYPIDIRVRDVNGDNKLDILTANYNPNFPPTVNPATPTSSFSVVLQK